MQTRIVPCFVHAATNLTSSGIPAKSYCHLLLPVQTSLDPKFVAAAIHVKAANLDSDWSLVASSYKASGAPAHWYYGITVPVAQKALPGAPEYVQPMFSELFLPGHVLSFRNVESNGSGWSCILECDDELAACLSKEPKFSKDSLASADEPEYNLNRSLSER